MKNYQASSNKKIEMVPLIDVIFLLLIFFLVTLNIIPVLSNKDILEAQFAMPVVTAEDAAQVDMLIQLHQFGTEEKIHYFTIDGQLNRGTPFTEAQWQQTFQWVTKKRLNDLQKRFKGHYFDDVTKIDFDNKKQVIINTAPGIPFRHLVAVIQECVNRGIKYYCNVSPFENLKGKIHFPEPVGFAERYNW